MQPEMPFVLSIGAGPPATRPQDQLEMFWDWGVEFGRRANLNRLGKRIPANIHFILAPALECCNAFPPLGPRHGYGRERCLGLGCLHSKNRLLGRIFTEGGVFKLDLIWGHHCFAKNPARLCRPPNFYMSLLIREAKKPKGLQPQPRILGT